MHVFKKLYDKIELTYREVLFISNSRIVSGVRLF